MYVSSPRISSILGKAANKNLYYGNKYYSLKRLDNKNQPELFKILEDKAQNFNVTDINNFKSQVDKCDKSTYFLARTQNDQFSLTSHINELENSSSIIQPREQKKMLYKAIAEYALAMCKKHYPWGGLNRLDNPHKYDPAFISNFNLVGEYRSLKEPFGVDINRDSSLQFVPQELSKERLARKCDIEKQLRGGFCNELSEFAKKFILDKYPDTYVRLIRISSDHTVLIIGDNLDQLLSPIYKEIWRNVKIEGDMINIPPDQLVNLPITVDFLSQCKNNVIIDSWANWYCKAPHFKYLRENLPNISTQVSSTNGMHYLQGTLSIENISSNFTHAKLTHISYNGYEIINKQAVVEYNQKNFLASIASCEFAIRCFHPQQFFEVANCYSIIASCYRDMGNLSLAKHYVNLALNQALQGLENLNYTGRNIQTFKKIITKHNKINELVTSSIPENNVSCIIL